MKIVYISNDLLFKIIDIKKEIKDLASFNHPFVRKF